MNMKSFYYIRHGETNWNKKNIPMGQTNIELNQRGIHQAQLAASILSDIDFSAICVSPLTRALKTAEIINQNNKPMLIFDELKEACFGEQEGKVRDNNFYFKWRQEKAPVGAEKYSDFLSRVKQGLTKIFALQEPVLIVSHGAVYWAVQQILALSTHKMNLDNCVPLYHQKITDSSWNVKPLSQDYIID